MSLFVCLIIALVISFLGSLPIGLITLTIVQKTIQQGRRSGVLLSLGATVLEFVYTFIALISFDTLTQSIHVGAYFKIVASIVFLGMGVYFLTKTSKRILETTSAYDYFDFFRGIVVGAMNVLIIPFWVFIIVWLKTQEVIVEGYSEMIFFSIGSAAGALLAFLGYVLASEYIAGKMASVNRYTNKVVGVLFLGLGLFQLVQLIN